VTGREDLRRVASGRDRVRVDGTACVLLGTSGTRSGSSAMTQPARSGTSGRANDAQPPAASIPVPVQTPAHQQICTQHSVCSGRRHARAKPHNLPRDHRGAVPASQLLQSFTVNPTDESLTSTLAHQITVTVQGPPDQLLCDPADNGGFLISGTLDVSMRDAAARAASPGGGHGPLCSVMARLEINGRASWFRAARPALPHRRGSGLRSSHQRRARRLPNVLPDRSHAYASWREARLGLRQNSFS